MSLKYLFLPHVNTKDVGALAKACAGAGVRVIRWVPGDAWSAPPDCTIFNTSSYGSLRNGRLIARQLGGRVVEPPATFLPGLPTEYRHRTIELNTLAGARQIQEPRFIKPATAQAFRAKVCATGADLDVTYLPDDQPTLIAEVVTWEAEFRIFMLNREVYTYSPYSVIKGMTISRAHHDAALAFCRRVGGDLRVELPYAVVLDVGFIRDRGWAIVEANPVIACALYQCSPAIVMKVLAHGLTLAEPAPTSRKGKAAGAS